MAKLVIFGAGDIARIAHYYFTRDSEHEVAGFCVDADYREGESFAGRPLVDFEAVADRFPPPEFSGFVALSYAKMNRIREERYHAMKDLGYDCVSYVSSRASYLSDEPPGENCFILEDNTVQPFVRIGTDVTLWSGNHIGHDSVIEDHCFVSSHVVVSGNCRVGHHSFLGVNATISNSLRIGPRSLIAAGAVVMKDTPEGAVLVPERARKLSKTSDQFDL